MLTDIKKEDLEEKSSELWSDLKDIVDDVVAPKVGSAMEDVRARGHDVGASLSERIPDQVTDHLPDAITDRLPSKDSGWSWRKKLLVAGAVSAVAAVGVSAWRRRQAAAAARPVPPRSGENPDHTHL